MLDAVGAMGAMGGRINPYQANRPKPGHLFNDVDRNKDGSLDKTEVQAFVDRLAEKTQTSIDGDAFFAKLDANEDGLINKEEFKTGRDILKTFAPGKHPGPGRVGGRRERPDGFEGMFEDILTQESDDEDSLNNEVLNRLSSAKLASYELNLNAFQKRQDPFNILA